MIAPAPAVLEGDRIILDGKFASGMQYQAGLFEGEFDCILRESQNAIPFDSVDYRQDLHGFRLTVLPRDGVVTENHLGGYDVIFCSADDERNFDVPAKARAVNAKLATTLEYTLKTRLAINALNNEIGIIRRWYRSLRLRWKERARGRFLGQMDGIQANGYPAFDVCKQYDPNTLFFLDSRMKRSMLASKEDQSARRSSILGGNPLRLVFSGRLDPMKGAHHLVPVAHHLNSLGVPFKLKIYGTGSLERTIAAEIEEKELKNVITLCGPVDYQTELVPQFRTSADIFLSCHLQDDPSCSFIEAMGCGLAVLGYGNLMWHSLCVDSSGGWVTPARTPKAMAKLLATLHRDRNAVVAATEAALKFARQHDFETMSKRRVDHLAHIANSDARTNANT